MNAKQLLGALGVPFREVQEDPDHVGPELDCAPGIGAEARWTSEGLVVFWLSHVCRWATSFVDVLHEALHLVVGPSSLRDENVLMAYQAALIAQLSDPVERSRARADFADFGFMWTHPDTEERLRGITDDDAVFRSQQWGKIQRKAVAAGLLVERRGQLVPVFGLGIHPGWAEWREREIKAAAARARPSVGVKSSTASSQV
jgi:hypothetical protein